jgi:hypothetical protein
MNIQGVLENIESEAWADGAWKRVQAKSTKTSSTTGKYNNVDGDCDRMTTTINGVLKEMTSMNNPLKTMLSDRERNVQKGNVCEPKKTDLRVCPFQQISVWLVYAPFYSIFLRQVLRPSPTEMSRREQQVAVHCYQTRQHQLN